MTRNQFKLGVAVCCLFSCWANVTHAGMIYKSVDRIIFGNGTQLDAEQQSSDTEAPFTTDLLNSGYVRDDSGSIVGSVSAFASQSSTLTSNQIRGLSRGSGFGSGGATGVGRSSMAVEFDISESMQFTLTGQLRMAPHGESISLNGSNAYIRLTGPDGVAMEVMMDEDNLPNSLGAVDFTGADRLSKVFPAGSYMLEAFSEGHGADGKTRCVDFDFTFTALEALAVPEPASGGILAFGLICLARLRRRRG